MIRAALALLLLGTAGAVPAATPERLSVVANGEVVGTLTGTTEGDRVSIDYRVDDNGRGPKQHEEIVLGADGVPVSWTITGTSLMGGAVAERFAAGGGRATWTSQADRGDVAVTGSKLYIANDDSPWATGLYARAALAKGGSVEALPGGRITATRLRTLAIGGVPVTVYRVDGAQLAPDYVALDADKRLFAQFGATGVTIRTGFEKEAPVLAALGAELAGERVRAISAKVAHRFAMPVRIRGVRVFDAATGTLGALSTVVTMRDRIVQILPGDGGAAPNDEVIVEGDGGTLYPGLADMHSHSSIESGLFYLAAGVTRTRDMGNKNTFLLDLIPRVEAGEIAGPYIVPAGFIEGRSAFSARNGIIPETLPAALEAVRWYADHGYFEVKLYNSFPPDWVRPVAAEAHRLGLKVSGHVPAFSSPDRVIADGYDAIAHINQLMLGWVLDPTEDTRTPLRLTGMARAADLDLRAARVRATVAAMTARGVSLDTTAVILERLMLSRAGVVGAGDADYLSHMPIGYQRYRKRTFVPLKDAAEDARYFKAFDTVLATMRMLHKAGVPLLPGTDDATGFTLQRELVLYARAGIAPADALRAATLGAAEYLGDSATRGTIARGKVADLVLVAGDPTRDIAAVTRPRMVMRSGTIYFPSEIHAALGIAPFTTPPAMRVPVVPKGDTHDPGAFSLFGAGADPDAHIDE